MSLHFLVIGCVLLNHISVGRFVNNQNALRGLNCRVIGLIRVVISVQVGHNE